MNKLSVTCDYLRFTFPVGVTVLQVFDFLGFDTDLFMLSSHGGDGYKRMYVCYQSNIRIYFDGREDMGVHVAVSGSSISYFLKLLRSSFSEGFDVPYSDFEFFILILQFLRDYGCRFTRFDLACDDIGNNYFSVDGIKNFYDNNQLLSRFRSIQHIKNQDISSHTIIGNTLNIGSRKSDTFLRIYDKQLELNNSDSGLNIDYPWTRWEFEFKGKKADIVVDKLLEGIPLNILFFSVLNSKISLIIRDDSNVSRCSKIPLWLEFISSADKFHFDIEKPERTLSKVESYLIKQCVPSLAKYISLKGELPHISKGMFNRIVTNWAKDPLFMDTCTAENIDYLESLFTYDF